MSAAPRRWVRGLVLVVVLAALGAGSWAMGLISNVATDSKVFSRSPDQVIAAVRSAAAEMPRWTSVKDDKGSFHFEARTALFKFVDDVTIDIAAEGSGSKLKIRSASREGLSDFGTNGRRIRAFLALVDEKLK